MPTFLRAALRRLSLAGATLCALASGPVFAMPLPSAKDLQKLAPQASLPTLELALTAYACASASQGGDNGLLTVIDYSRPSRDKRLWVFDLKARKLLFEEWVTHGKNSGDDLATSFSNRPNSYQSSIGLFQTGNDSQCCRLTTSRRSQQSNKLPFTDLKTDIIQNCFAFCKTFLYLLQFK